VIQHVLGKDTFLANVVCFALSFVQVAFTDLFFILFFASQELMDSSNIQMMNMKPFYGTGQILGAIFFSKVTMNLILIVIVNQLARRFINVYEGHAVGVLVIYFICAYEFIINVLVTLGRILRLDTINTTSNSNVSDMGFGGGGVFGQ